MGVAARDLDPWFHTGLDLDVARCVAIRAGEHGPRGLMAWTPNTWEKDDLEMIAGTHSEDINHYLQMCLKQPDDSWGVEVTDFQANEVKPTDHPLVHVAFEHRQPRRVAISLARGRQLDGTMRHAIALVGAVQFRKR